MEKNTMRHKVDSVLDIQFFGTKQLAELCDCTPANIRLRALRNPKSLPKSYMILGNRRWKKEDVEEWLRGKLDEEN